MSDVHARIGIDCRGLAIKIGPREALSNAMSPIL